MPKINRSARYKEVVHVLNLGAGVQSTTLYLMACEGRLKFDVAIMADTQEEPEGVYHHLDWMKTLSGPPIMVRTIGKLGNDLIRGRNAAGGGKGRFASIPAFLKMPDREKGGIGRRQCTREYKVDVVERTIRREVFGVRPKCRVRRHQAVQYIGISTDEAGRAVRVRSRFEKLPWSSPKFPLIDMGMNRGDCVEYLKTRCPHPVPKSSCVFCPYRTNQSWAALKRNDPSGFARAVEIDYAIRDKTSKAAQGLNGEQYIHRSLIPLDLIDFDKLAPNTLDPMTVGECQGMCGL